MTGIAMVPLLSNLDRTHTQCNASSIYLEETFPCRVDFQLIYINVKRRKKVYIQCKSKKNTQDRFTTP